jgi:hypothetical protein
MNYNFHLIFAEHQLGFAGPAEQLDRACWERGAATSSSRCTTPPEWPDCAVGNAVIVASLPKLPVLPLYRLNLRARWLGLWEWRFTLIFQQLVGEFIQRLSGIFPLWYSPPSGSGICHVSWAPRSFVHFLKVQSKRAATAAGSIIISSETSAGDKTW